MNIEKIAVNGYYVWVDKDEIVGWSYNGICYNDDGRIGKPNNPNSKKIIAASPELKLKGVPSYARYKALEYSKPLEKEVKSDEDYDWYMGSYKGFEYGYLEAEKELFTEDDVRKAIELAREGYSSIHSEEEIIEQLKQSK